MAKVFKTIRLSKKAVTVILEYKKSENKSRKKDAKLNFSTAVDELITAKKFTAKDIRKRLLQMNPQIKENSKYTNPFLYDDTKKWYHELGLTEE
jgi:hypothetical protein